MRQSRRLYTDPARFGGDAADEPWQRKRLPDAKDDFFISPASIAGEALHLAHKPQNAWPSFAKVRPFHEPWGTS